MACISQELTVPDSWTIFCTWGLRSEECAVNVLSTGLSRDTNVFDNGVEHFFVGCAVSLVEYKCLIPELSICALRSISPGKANTVLHLIMCLSICASKLNFVQNFLQSGLFDGRR
jgi:hypothetical protein